MIFGDGDVEAETVQTGGVTVGVDLDDGMVRYLGRGDAVRLVEVMLFSIWKYKEF